MKKVILIIILTGLFLTVISCDNNNELNENSGKFSIKISDSPMPYDQFMEANVTIDKIEIRNSKDQTDFVVLTEESMTFNMMELVNGITETLADVSLPEGNYDMLRLYISSTEMVMNNGESYFEEMDYGNRNGNNGMIQGGMMMNGENGSIDIPFDDLLSMSYGMQAEFLLDIDINRSFNLEDVEYYQMGSQMMMRMSGFSFEPVMRFVNLSEVGTISGTVKNGNVPLASATVNLMQNNKIYTSTHSDENGNYALIGIPKGGSYSIEIEIEGYTMDDSQNSTTVGNFEMMTNSVKTINFYMIPEN